MNQEVFAALADALEQGEETALVTIVGVERIHAAARRRQDARLRGRPHRRHDWRRLLRERRVRKRARGDQPRNARSTVGTSSTTTSRRRRASCAAGRWKCSSSRWKHRRRSTSSGPATSATASRKLAHDVGFRVHVVDDREKFANAERFGPGIDVVVDDIPTWLGTHGAARHGLRGHRHPRPSPRPGRAARADGVSRCAISGLIGSKAKVKRIFDALLEEGLPDRAPGHRSRADRSRHRRDYAPGNRRQHRGRADRGEARQDRRTPAAQAVSMRWDGALRYTGSARCKLLITNGFSRTRRSGPAAACRPCPGVHRDG